MDEPGDLEGEALLRDAARRLLALAALQLCDLIQGQKREDTQVLAGLRVLGVDPVLVQLVGRGHLRIEEERARFGLAELLAGAVGDEWMRQRVHVHAAHAANQIHPRRDIAPLILAADLHGAAERVVQMQVVDALQDHVAELGV